MAAVASPTKVVGRRVLAFLIDLLVTGVVYWGLFFLFAERATSTGEGLSARLDAADGAYLQLGDSAYAVTGSDGLVFFLIYLAIGLLYWVVLQGLTGSTLGKAVTGIRTVGRDGGRPGVGRALVRALAWIVDYFPYIIPGLVGFILSLTTRDNRRLGDMAAGTLVVRRSAVGAPVASAPGPVAPTQAQPAAAGPAGHAAPAAVPEANWYPDPQGRARLRYWDGSSWTEHTSN